MPNRIYIDLKNDTTQYEGEWLNIANRYEKIAETLNSPDVDPIIREAIFYSLYNFKSWYATYGMLKSYDGLQQDFESSWHLINSLSARIEYWVNRTDQLLNMFGTLSAQLSDPDIWGYELRWNEWENDLYDQLRLIDSLYGRSASPSQSIFDSIIMIENLNASITALNERFTGLTLPYQLYFAKSSEDIDYTKITGEIIGIDNNFVTTMSESDFSQFNKLTKMTLPELEAGQYMLRVKNNGTLSISNSIPRQDGWYDVIINRDFDMAGWLVDNKYPIIFSESIGVRTYSIYLGVRGLDLVNKTIYENYINPISLILDVKFNEEQVIYDFFYGQYFDEFKEVLSNGNHSYLRTIKNRDGVVLSVYRMELDFNTKSDQGLPTIYYEKVQ